MGNKTLETPEMLERLFNSDVRSDRLQAANAGYRIDELKVDKDNLVKAYAYVYLLKDRKNTNRAGILMDMSKGCDEVALQAAKRVANPQNFDIKNHRLLFLKNVILTDDHRLMVSHLKDLKKHPSETIAQAALNTLKKYDERLKEVLLDYQKSVREYDEEIHDRIQGGEDPLSDGFPAFPAHTISNT